MRMHFPDRRSHTLPLASKPLQGDKAQLAVRMQAGVSAIFSTSANTVSVCLFVCLFVYSHVAICCTFLPQKTQKKNSGVLCSCLSHRVKICNQLKMGIWLQLTMIQPENHQDENRHCTPLCCALPASFTQTKLSPTNHNIYTNKTVTNKPQHLHKQNCHQQTTTFTQTKLSSTNHNIYTNKTVVNKPQHLHKQNCRQQTTIFVQNKTVVNKPQQKKN